MGDSEQNPQLREAIEELQQYLSDTLPPLVVADSIKLLLKYPPQIVASNIHAWTAAQYRRGAEIPLSDYLFHAVKKIQLMGEFRLVPQEPFVKYLEGLKSHVLGYCPEGDREFLKANLDRLAESAAGLSSPVEVLFRQQGGAGERPLATRATGSTAASAPELLGLRRVSMVLERLEREVLRHPSAREEVKKGPLAAQALA
ncbi:MAG TPA: hypothetical protein VKJ00_02370, partial [Thermoanaerobaculia bacterium]|nr:hypothetical protein [Thermoanaerobaculia bacterium]